MSPQELRAFRESLGLSRREFAPKLHISEPTLERWERGQSGPRDLHLHILRQMQEHLESGQSITYFQYDATQAPRDSAENLSKAIAEALKAVGILLRHEQRNTDSWTLTFTVGWARGQPIDLSLTCEGSYRPERPMIDFTLTIRWATDDFSNVVEKLSRACLDHRIPWQPLTDKSGPGLLLYQRLFNTACNPATVQHLLGNYRACFNRLKGLIQSGGTLERTSDNGKVRPYGASN